MKQSLRSLLLAGGIALLCGGLARAGEVDPSEPTRATLSLEDFDPPQFEFAAETAYLLGFIGNPNAYEVGAQFLTARMRWGVNRDDHSIFRGYNQIYLLGMAEPIFRGPENRYFGISAGFRHVFVRPGWRLQPYASGGLGLGFIDSTDAFRDGQGQDFTFNILTAVGVDFLVNDHWKVNVGALYQHLSNAGLTDPNPSLNLIGPQVGATFSF
ncbi:MAG: acyloxyacyl hydrolase [Verrucomicrobiota bacterium]|nr:acyloxyacyl hydrolase [Verrucomicrobiota bacterium]